MVIRWMRDSFQLVVRTVLERLWEMRSGLHELGRLMECFRKVRAGQRRRQVYIELVEALSSSRMRPEMRLTPPRRARRPWMASGS